MQVSSIIQATGVVDIRAPSSGRKITDPSVIARREEELKELQRKKQVLEQKKAQQSTAPAEGEPQARARHQLSC